MMLLLLIPLNKANLPPSICVFLLAWAGKPSDG